MSSAREISREKLEELREKLKAAEKPVKQTYRRKDALFALLPEIRRLRSRKKMTYAEIAQVISELSGGELKPECRELAGLFPEEKETFDGATELASLEETPVVGEKGEKEMVP